LPRAVSSILLELVAIYQQCLILLLDDFLELLELCSLLGYLHLLLFDDYQGILIFLRLFQELWLEGVLLLLVFGQEWLPCHSELWLCEKMLLLVGGWPAC